jgi:hypothetical protein
MKHWELMQYANAFFMATKLFANEIEAHIAREEATPKPGSSMRIQAYRNVLKAQAANSMAAVADVEVTP